MGYNFKYFHQAFHNSAAFRGPGDKKPVSQAGKSKGASKGGPAAGAGAGLQIPPRGKGGVARTP